MPGNRVMAGRLVAGRISAGSPVALAKPNLGRRSEGTDTMQAWERFLTGGPNALVPTQNFVVASWLRSQEHGINPTGRSAPIVATGSAIHALRRRHAEFLAAAAGVFAHVGEMFSGSGSMLLLTNTDGVILDAVGDRHTLEQGEDIHLTPGGDWREGAIGTNGIGTALATGRPAQVHASEHFCEGFRYPARELPKIFRLVQWILITDEFLKLGRGVSLDLQNRREPNLADYLLEGIFSINHTFDARKRHTFAARL